MQPDDGEELGSSLRRLLRLARHHAYLLQHAHEIVKKILFHDLALFVPARNGTEIHVETLVRGLDHRSAWHRHRTCHRSPEIRHSACPFALGQHDFVWIVDEMLVRERLEECNRLLFVGVYAVCGRLIRPAHDAILRVIFSKCSQVLCVPRIIQLRHILQICCCIHNEPRVPSRRSIRFNSDSRGRQPCPVRGHYSAEEMRRFVTLSFRRAYAAVVAPTDNKPRGGLFGLPA